MREEDKKEDKRLFEDERKKQAMQTEELTLDEYQNHALSTAIFPGQGEMLGVMYCALKLAGEAGEVAEKIGKILRDKNGDVEEARTPALARELGDVLWYVAVLAKELNFSFEDIAKMNLEKLQDRDARGVLGGSGDFR